MEEYDEQQDEEQAASMNIDFENMVNDLSKHKDLPFS